MSACLGAHAAPPCPAYPHPQWMPTFLKDLRDLGAVVYTSKARLGGSHHQNRQPCR